MVIADLANVEPDDPYRREAQIFPRLSDEQCGRIAAYGPEESLRAGTLVFERGQRTVDFFLVLEGSIEIFDYRPDGEPNVFTVHRDHQFTGELDLFNNREILVSGRTGTDSRVIRVGRADFSRMVSTESDIGEIIMRAFILRRLGFIRHGQGGVVLVGSGHSFEVLRIQRFLTRNGYPHRLLDSDTDDDAGSFISGFGLAAVDLPVLIAPGNQVLRNPSNAELADHLGLTEPFDPTRVYDVAVVGAGPAGLASAVYAASEGLSTLVVEALAPGGQAGTSSRIENYLGFPTGISGLELAGRAQNQAQKFGAHLAVSRPVLRMECQDSKYRLYLDGEQTALARSVVVATGARYRKLNLPNYESFEGRSIHYAATALEAQLCQGEIAVVGGGNSAGQAAVFLSRHAAHVHLLVRGAGLAATMSDYLVQRIVSSPHITLHPFTEIQSLHGELQLEEVTWRNSRTGETEKRPIGNVFVMIGAAPNTEWLGHCLKLDAKGFIVTGQDKDGQLLPSPYATTAPGVFAVGDVRSGSVKRVASAVGEGSVVVHAIHRYLNPETG